MSRFTAKSLCAGKILSTFDTPADFSQFSRQISKSLNTETACGCSVQVLTSRAYRGHPTFPLLIRLKTDLAFNAAPLCVFCERIVPFALHVTLRDLRGGKKERRQFVRKKENLRLRTATASDGANDPLPATGHATRTHFQVVTEGDESGQPSGSVSTSR